MSSFRQDATAALEQSWSIHDGVLHSDRGWTCQWANYTSQANPSSTTSVCVHPGTDIVSTTVANRGHWHDCFAISRQWQAVVDETTTTTTAPLSSWHVDIGANVGCCVIELLLADPLAQIVAVEPHPQNLFALTSTLTAHPHLASRVHLYPLALGHTPGQVQIALETGFEHNGKELDNFGASHILTREEETDTGLRVTHQHQVRMVRLDSLIRWMPNIRTMKLDVQGWECGVLDGADYQLYPQLLPERIISELETKSLQRARCSPEGLLERLRKLNYEVKRYRGGGQLTQININIDSMMVAIKNGGAME